MLAAVLTASAILGVLERAGATRPLEDTITSVIPTPRGWVLTALIVASLAADAVVVWPALLACIAYAAVRGGKVLEGPGTLAAALAIAEVLAASFKLLFAIPRPEGGVHGFILSYSYPSGHVSRFSVITFWASRRFGRASVAVWVVLACVAASRVLLRAHYVVDVVGGFLMGFSAITALELLRGVLSGRPTGSC